jgi:hypothetical protein
MMGGWRRAVELAMTVRRLKVPRPSQARDRTSPDMTQARDQATATATGTSRHTQAHTSSHHCGRRPSRPATVSKLGTAGTSDRTRPNARAKLGPWRPRADHGVSL